MTAMSTRGFVTAPPSARKHPIYAGLAALLLLFLTLAPKTFELWAPTNLTHSGIVGAAPQISTYLVVILATMTWVVIQVVAGVHERVLPGIVIFGFFPGLVVWTLAAWGTSSVVLSGVLQYATGITAWIVGAHLARRAWRTRPGPEWFALAIAAVVGVEAAVSILQSLGSGIFPMPPELAVNMGTRVNGTTAHPNNLGKLMLLVTFAALCVASQCRPPVRRVLWLSVALTFVPLALSQGRANMAAQIVMLVLWALISGRKQKALVRFGIPFAVVALVIPFVGLFQARMQADPEGGDRPQLLATGLHQISSSPILGTGPNNYVEVVSQYDQLVATTKFPVHNAFLLSAAEIGVPLAVLFWSPLALLLWRAVRCRKSPALEGHVATAVLASAPGMLVVTATGWAMLFGSLLPLWFALYGMAWGVLRRPSPRLETIA